MRVLHCIPSLVSGGAERQLTYLCAGLIRKGWDVDVLFMRSGIYYDRLKQDGVGLHPLAIRHNYDPVLPWKVFRLVRALRPAVVQTWMPQMDIVAGGIARLLRIPWVLSEGSAARMYPLSLRHWIRNRVARGVTVIAANSSGGSRYWHGRLPSSVAQQVIPNGLPLEDIDRAAPALADGVRLRAGQKLILYVGRLSPEKNPAGLVRALPRIPGEFAAVFCGEGPCEPRLRRYLEAHSLSGRVVLAGYVPGVWSLMKRADVMVSVSLVEGQPNAVLEAMACGCPLVVSDIPAHREFLDEQSALLVDPDEPRALAAAIRQVLAGGVDVVRRVQAARQRVEALTIGRLIDAYDQLYRRLVPAVGPAGCATGSEGNRR